MAERIVPGGITGGRDALAIIGWEEGNAGQVATWIEQAASCRLACFVNPSDEPLTLDADAIRRMRPARQFDVPSRDSFKGVPLVTAGDWPQVLRELNIFKALVLTSAARARHRQIEMARGAGVGLVNAIHPTAIVLADAILEDNVVLLPQAIIGYRAEVQCGALLNIRAQIDHHTVLGRCATLDPAAVTAGNVRVGAFAHLHTGAVIINRITIGEGAVVGAGAVVIEDVPDGATVVGVPARPIRRAAPA